jgi:hypothetical protein
MFIFAVIRIFGTNGDIENIDIFGAWISFGQRSRVEVEPVSPLDPAHVPASRQQLPF